MPCPVALTIAGSDSGGGAGIQADLKTFSALGVFGTSAITLVTAQNTVGVTGIEMISTGNVRAQIAAVLSDLRPAAIKLGALGSSEMIAAVAEALEAVDLPIVLDPVMIAKSGDPLLQEEAVATLKQKLLPRAAIVTPNLPEAARLLDEAALSGEEEIEAQGRRLRALGPEYVLMKGGHGTGAESTDLLIGPGPVQKLSAPRIATGNTHGTGCTLSAAIAAYLAHGLEMPRAVEGAKAFLSRAIATADRLELGAGHGPVDHFHAIWPGLSIG